MSARTRCPLAAFPAWLPTASHCDADFVAAPTPHSGVAEVPIPPKNAMAERPRHPQRRSGIATLEDSQNGPPVPQPLQIVEDTRDAAVMTVPPYRMTPPSQLLTPTARKCTVKSDAGYRTVAPALRPG